MKTYYHITPRFLGQEAILDPKKRSSEFEYAAVSVSPTIIECIIGVPERVYKKDLYVYKIETDLAFPRKKVFDFYLTREHLIRRKIKATYVGRVDYSFVNIVNSFVYNDVAWELRKDKLFLRIIKRTIFDMWMSDKSIFQPK